MNNGEPRSVNYFITDTINYVSQYMDQKWWDWTTLGTLTVHGEFLAHLCHLAEVKAWPGAGQDIWIMAPLQARFSHVAGLWMASWQRWVQVTPRGGWCTAGWSGRWRQGRVLHARTAICQSRSRGGLRGQEHHRGVLNVHWGEGEAAM